MTEHKQSKVAEIRFRGFDGDWDDTTLGDTLPITSAARVHKDQWTKSGVRFFRSSDVVSNYKGNHNEKAFISHELYRELTDKIGRIHKGDILITGGGSIGIPYLVESDEPLYFKDADLLWLKVRDALNSDFLYTYFSSRPFRKHLKSISHIGTIAHYTVEQAKSTPIRLPAESDEQTLIGQHFAKLDAMISQHQQKHAKLVALKKAMLQKMFPRDGATTPEIRFKGFSGDWEEKALGEVCRAAYGGGTPSTSVEAYWRGHIPWIQSSDLTSDNVFQVSPRKHISEEAIRKSATKLVPANSLAVVTRVGVGKLVFIPFEYATSQDFLSLSDLLIDGSFLAYAGMVVLRRKLHEVQGTSIKGLTKEELLSVTIFAPHDEHEQRSVGRYFKELDELVKVHATQISKLRNIKAACLEKMFV